MNTITAKVPAKKLIIGGKPQTRPAYEMTFSQDEKGRWSSDLMGAMTEEGVLDVCKQASNWREIRATHFQMVGF